MPFTAWRAPNKKQLQIRTISRHIENLTVQHTRDQNRLYAAQGSISTPLCVIQDLKRALASGERRILKLRREAMALVRSDDSIRQRYDLLTSIPGIAQISAIQLLGELATQCPDMMVRQWVAHSGLDPAHEVSGTSVRKQSRISRAGNRHLRRALYMPALVASRCDPHMRAFYESLLSRHKARLQVLVAVASKLILAICGILRSKARYDGCKLFPALLLGKKRESSSQPAPKADAACLRRVQQMIGTVLLRLAYTALLPADVLHHTTVEHWPFLMVDHPQFCEHRQYLAFF